MGLKFPDQVARVQQGTTLTITPRETESFRINRIGFARPTADSYATIRIGRMLVGYIPVRMPGGFIPFHYAVHGSGVINPYDYGEEGVINLRYPVATGENFRITTGAATDIFIDYDIFEAGNVPNTEPNGTASKELTYYITLTNAASIPTTTTTAYHVLNRNILPLEFPRFPVERVPSGVAYDIKALGAIAMSQGNGTANTLQTRYLRLKYNRQVLYDPTELGFQIMGRADVIAAAANYEQVLNEISPVQTPTVELYKFDPILVMKEGDIFDTEVGIRGAAAGAVAANMLFIYYIVTVKRGG